MTFCCTTTNLIAVKSGMKTILFVCTGNICRSPMAEGLFRQAFKGRGDFEVYSAGVGAVDGLPPSEHAVRALKEMGIDISHQRSRMLSGELVRRADYIFGMTRQSDPKCRSRRCPASRRTREGERSSPPRADKAA